MTFRNFSASPTSIVALSTTTLILSFLLLVLLARAINGILTINVKTPLTLSKLLFSAPILTHWIPNRQTTLETDASDYAIGAILSITLSDGEIHPVAYHSRTLTEPELNYDPL